MKNELSIAIKAAKQTKSFLNREYKDDPKIISSNLRDIKTKADINAEEIILSILSKTNYPLISEESSSEDKKAIPKNIPYWIVDPLDGTLNFSRKLPLSTISIAMWLNNNPLLGVVQPLNTDKHYAGIVGEQAWYGDKTIKVSKVNKKEDAILATGFPTNRSFEDKSLLKTLNEIRNYKKVRMLGCASLMLCYVASGQFDAYQEEDIHLWDVAAGFAIVKAAGGQLIFEEGSSWHQLNAKATNGCLK